MLCRFSLALNRGHCVWPLSFRNNGTNVHWQRWTTALWNPISILPEWKAQVQATLLDENHQATLLDETHQATLLEEILQARLSAKRNFRSHDSSQMGEYALESELWPWHAHWVMGDVLWVMYRSQLSHSHLGKIQQSMSSFTFTHYNVAERATYTESHELSMRNWQSQGFPRTDQYLISLSF